MNCIFCCIPKQFLQGFCNFKTGIIGIAFREKLFHKCIAFFRVCCLCCCNQHRRPAGSFRVKSKRCDSVCLQPVTAVPEFFPCLREFLNPCFRKKLRIPKHAGARKCRRTDRSKIDIAILIRTAFHHRRFDHIPPLFILFQIRTQILDPSIRNHHLIKGRQGAHIIDHSRKLVCDI